MTAVNGAEIALLASTCLNETKRKLRNLLAVVLLSYAGFGSPATAQGTSGATAVVDQFQDALMEVMRNAKTLGYSGRYRQLEPILSDYFDLPIAARIAVGQYWQQLDTKQQSQYVEKFNKLSVATFAHEFDGYSGEHFETVSTQTLPNGDAYVRALLHKPDGKDVHFDYLLRRGNGGWRILNIIVDGVSDLAIKRSEYTGILRRDGYNALLKKIDEKITQYQDSKA